MTHTPASTPLSPEEEARLVHKGIQEVAARCNGAVTLDYKGFDGQDTHYGRRIASVPFETLTADDREEEARIANKYREQILTYTGVDVRDFSVVLDAKEASTNHASRDNARRYEKQATMGTHVTLVGNEIVFKFAYNPDLSNALKAAAGGRGQLRWNEAGDKTWRIPTALVTPALAIEVKQPHWNLRTAPDAWAILSAAQDAPVAPAAAPVADTRPQVALDRDGRLVVSQHVTADAEVRRQVIALPGRRWNGTNNVVPATAEAKALFARLGLVLTDNAIAALASVGETLADEPPATLNRAGLMSLASRAGSVDDLPEAFVALIQQAAGL